MKYKGGVQHEQKMPRRLWLDIVIIYLKNSNTISRNNKFAQEHTKALNLNTSILISSLFIHMVKFYEDAYLPENLSLFSQSVSLTQYVVLSVRHPVLLFQLAYCLNDQAHFA